MSSAIAAPSPEPAPLSEPLRIIDTLIAPGKTFTDLRRSAAWWGPYILLVLVTFLFTYAIDKQIGFRKVVENQIQASPKATQRMERMPAEQRDQAISTQARGTRFFLYAYGVVILLWNLLIAVILLGTFKFGASADVKFKTALSIVMYASLPLVVKSVLAAVSIFAGASADSFMLQNPMASNPGYFLTPSDSPFLYSLATSLDVFMIWTLVLTAIGFTCVSKVKRSTAYAVVFGWYVVFILAAAGIGAAFS